MSQAKFQKRQREMARAEKAKAKAARKQERLEAAAEAADAPTPEVDAGSVMAKLEKLHQDFADDKIDFDEFEENQAGVAQPTAGLTEPSGRIRTLGSGRARRASPAHRSRDPVRPLGCQDGPLAPGPRLLGEERRSGDGEEAPMGMVVYCVGAWRRVRHTGPRASRTHDEA